jgi:uncharacterized coiled-coil protein SlyX
MISNQLNYPSVFLGFSKKYTLASDGCTVACLGERLGYTIVEMNELLKENDCFALYNGEKCIVNWSKLPSVFPQIKKCIRVTTYDNDKVLEIIKREGGCIVCVDYDGNLRTVGDHFVVFKGDKKLEDPLGGKVKPTSTYPLTKGYVDLEVDNGIIEEDMTQEDKSILAFIKEQNANEGKVREAFGALNDMPNLIKKISDLESSQKSLEERIEQLEADATANNNLIQSYQSQLKTANKTESKLQEEIETLKSDSNTWKNRYEAKCKETVDKYSALELLKLGIYKLLGKK